MKTYYHVSEKQNLDSIMKKGLVPQIGERSQENNEEAAVFLFPTKDDMDTALSQWLGEWYEDIDIVLMSLQIILPDDFPILDSNVDYEKVCKVIIPPEYIKYLKDE